MVTHDACWRRSSNNARSVFIVCSHASAAGARFRGPGGRLVAPCSATAEAGAPLVRARGHGEPLTTAERQGVENARHPRADDTHAVCARAFKALCGSHTLPLLPPITYGCTPRLLDIRAIRQPPAARARRTTRRGALQAAVGARVTRVLGPRRSPAERLLDAHEPERGSAPASCRSGVAWRLRGRVSATLRARTRGGVGDGQFGRVGVRVGLGLGAAVWARRPAELLGSVGEHVGVEHGRHPRGAVYRAGGHRVTPVLDTLTLAARGLELEACLTYCSRERRSLEPRREGGEAVRAKERMLF